MTGSLDWARLILREDARSGGADHLAEPWAIKLNEARLSSFLAVDGNASDNEREAFLSGDITDLQSRLNVANLIEGDAVSEPALASFARLFELLGLQESQLTLLAGQLLRASQNARQMSAEAVLLSAFTSPADAPLMPQRIEELVWLGLDQGSLQRLAPFITFLPEKTGVNLNTASPEVIFASNPGLEMAEAQKLVAVRERSHFRTLADAIRQINNPQAQLSLAQHVVASRFFEVRGRLRLDQSAVEERSVMQRDGLVVKTLWRSRGVIASQAAQGSVLP